MAKNTEKSFKWIRFTEETHVMLTNLKRLFMCDTYEELIGEKLKDILKWAALEHLADMADSVFYLHGKNLRPKLEEIVDLGVPMSMLCGHPATE